MSGDADGVAGHAAAPLRTVALLVAAALTAGCGSGGVVTTPESPPAPEAVASPPMTAAPTIAPDVLANAASYYRRDGERAGYWFSTPSGRYRCVVVPRTSAGCQATSGAALTLDAAPDRVPGPPDTDGSPGADVAPNTVRIARDDAGRFTRQPTADFAASPGEAPPVLPFGRVLSVAGFRCIITEEAGISCADDDTGAAFTFSGRDYAPVYTDAPAAPGRPASR